MDKHKRVLDAHPECKSARCLELDNIRVVCDGKYIYAPEYTQHVLALVKIHFDSILLEDADWTRSYNIAIWHTWCSPAALFRDISRGGVNLFYMLTCAG